MNRFSNLPIKRGIAALGIAAALGGTVVGVVGAQQATPTRPPGASATPGVPGQRSQREDTFFAAVAAKLGVTADKLKQAIADARQDLGLSAGPGGSKFGPGPGHRGPGGPGGPGLAGPMFWDTAAKTIGISADQLRQELPGKSLADVAKAHNVDAKKVADALKADETARIDQAVKDGRLTADQASQRKQEISARIDQLVSQAMPQMPAGGPGGPRGRGGPGGFGGFGGFGPRPGGPGAPGGSGTPAPTAPTGPRA